MTLTAEPTTGKGIASAFGLRGDGWMRHANPWSVWTRFAGLPLLALAIWSRAWIGWLCLVPVVLSVVWIAVNPLAFPPPRSTRNWASKAVFGERVWTEAPRPSLPEQFQSAVPKIAMSSQAVGVAALGYGLVVLDPVTAIGGLLIIQLAKAWYLDRMVLLFDAVRATDATYAGWERPVTTVPGV